MERYRVARREGIVGLIDQALRSSGADVLKTADPQLAPFEFVIRTAEGQVVDLLCYAFTANEYRQAGRPPGEHRFQIKYGSEFDRYHDIFIDPTRSVVTVMLGVHLERQLFVAVDPRMHSPTWFSSSVEFKSHDLEAARDKRWHGWERERSDGRRKQTRPEENLQTETVIGFTPDQFLRYVQFEKVASGLDCGERLQLSDRIEKGIGAMPPSANSAPHRLEQQLGVRADEILDIIAGAFRLAAAVRGGVAEHHLEKYLRSVPYVESVRHINEDGQPDFEVEYRRRPFLIECKNVLARRQGAYPRVDFQKTRASISDPCSRYYKATQFHVLAACLHPVTTRWEFRFAPTMMLQTHPKCSARLSPHVLVKEDWRNDLSLVLDDICRS